MSADTAGVDDAFVPALDDLPDGVRTRVVALTADVLPVLAKLPPTLRRAADFAPARRARLGGTAIREALADDDFRDRVGVQLAPRTDQYADDPASQAAFTWLTRPDGWTNVVRDLVADLGAPSAGDPDELTRLRDQLAELQQATQQAARDARSRARAQVEEYKVENLGLRRKLGEARAAERAARVTATESVAAAEHAEKRADAAEAASEKESRRLRSVIERLEADLAGRRRAERADRDELTLRARVLLDTVAEAASGLRHELMLPNVSGAPGDAVEADIERAGSPAANVPGALSITSSALLEQWLAMPRARLIVDGYNVAKTAWPSATLEQQRVRLLQGLSPVVARTGADVVVVFDAAAVHNRPVVAAPRGVKVLFSPEGVIADDVIRQLVDAEPSGRIVVVATDDQAVVRDVAAAGARPATASALVVVLGG
jgi:predicted RNA-binding protein with PIN domain